MWSPWSHCGVIDGDMVIQASTEGVIRTPLAEFKAHASEWAIVSFPANDNEAVARAANHELGQPYDYLGVAGIGLHRDWQDPSAWFCSELVAYVLACGGLHLFRSDAKRITPQHLWMLNYPIIDAA